MMCICRRWSGQEKRGRALSNNKRRVGCEERLSENGCGSCGNKLACEGCCCDIKYVCLECLSSEELDGERKVWGGSISRTYIHESWGEERLGIEEHLYPPSPTMRLLGADTAFALEKGKTSCQPPPRYFWPTDGRRFQGTAISPPADGVM